MTLGLSAKITETGISAPSFADILGTLQNKVREIYGSDIYIEPDSKDGQFIALVAQAIRDANDTAIAVHGQFSPGSAIGTGLSSVVKVNGISRAAASKSTAPGTVVGVAGTVIAAGTVKDANGNLWDLPANVLIPPAGQIDVTVTAQELGDINAASGTINKITTPVLGWQTFVSTADAAPGAPVETDATLRKRQSVSTALSASTPLGSMLGALLNLPGVVRAKVYENDTAAANADGIPAKSICAVVQGGDLAAIATTIGQKKTPGAGTHGTTTQSYTDPTTGIPYSIKFFVLANTAVKVKVEGTALTGFTTATAAQIKDEISAYIGEHDTGEDVEFTGLWAPAYLNLPARQRPYKINSLQVSTDGGATWNTNDVAVPFNSIAVCAATDVTVTIL